MKRNLELFLLFLDTRTIAEIFKSLQPCLTNFAAVVVVGCLRTLSETHKELKRATRVHSIRIFSFAKYHIWKQKGFVHK